MKKRFPALLLALSLLLTAPALAASDSTDNFVRSRAYNGQFSDVTTASVFYDNVAALYEYGLTVGKSDGTYGLEDSMTVGQIVIFAGRIRSLYRTGDAEGGPAAHVLPSPAAGEAAAPQAAYEPYLLYLQAEGVLGGELDGFYGQFATRAQVAHVLANALPAEALPLQNDALITQAYASRRFITDVTEYTPYYADILALYRQGVSVGSDESGSFLPDTFITRGAASAMLTRMVDSSLRLTPAWDVSALYSAKGTTLADLVPAGVYTAAPATAAEMEGSVQSMLAAGENVLTLQYPSITPVGARKVMEQALAVVKSYCEQCYNSVSCSFNAAGTVTLTFSAASAGEELEAYRTEAMEAAVAVHDALWESGTITAEMTELEKARVYYTWVCENTVYDYGADDTSLSHIAYRLFHEGLAVCDGYTGAYNMLLKLEGISCTALSNSGHIWTVAVLDGTQYHIDTTWGDSGSAIDYGYFAMTPSQSWTHHSW